MAHNVQQVVFTDQQFQQLLTNTAPRPGSEKRLPPFSSANATDWLSWKATFLRVAELKNWNDGQRRAQILAAMEGLACRQVQTINVDGPPQMTWREILTAYGNRFLPPAAGQLARQEFSSAAQATGESITAWHTRISELYSRAYPAGNVETDQQLCEQFMLGIANKEVMTRTFDVNPNTMTQCLEVATTKQANVKRVAQHFKQTGGRGMGNFMMTLGMDESEATAAKDEEDDPAVAAMNSECFHCRRTGHFRAECPLKHLPREQAQQRRSSNFRPRGGQRGRGRGGRRGGNRGRGGQRGRGRRSTDRAVNALAAVLNQALDLQQQGQEEEEGQEEQGN